MLGLSARVCRACVKNSGHWDSRCFRGFAFAALVLPVLFCAGPGVSGSLAQTRPGHLPGSAGPAPGNYQRLLHEIQRKRAEFARRYEVEDSEGKRQILREASDYLLQTAVNELFPRWYGTPWSFAGTAAQPGEDPIACGFFVVRILQHLGFKITAPSRLAQQPAENIIRNLVPATQIKRFSNVPVGRIERELRRWGRGLYLVGLDIHVGFVVNDGRSLRFVHSSYYNPPLCVLSEPLEGKNPFADSRYRVIGKLTNYETVARWVRNEAFELRYDYFSQE